MLPNMDVRQDQKVAPVAPRAASRLEGDLGAEGFVEASPQTGAVDFVGRTDGFLTGASKADPADIVLGYVGDQRRAFGLDASDLANLAVSESYTSIDGVTHVTFSQSVDGVESFDSRVRGHVTKNGRLINISGAPVSDLSVSTTTPALSADEALLAARENVGGDATVPTVEKRSQGPAQKTTYDTYAESAELTVFAQSDNDRLAWEVQVLDSDSILYQVVVDAATGDVLFRTSLTAFDNNDAQVWPLFPSKLVTPTAVNFGTDPTWLDRSAADLNQLKGNNTHTYVDLAVNGYQPGEQVVRNGGLAGNWTYPTSFLAGCPPFGCTWDSTDSASKATNRNAGAVGMFYLVNHFHDALLAAPIGFDEASGNFEHVNSSGQGVGGDAVLAEAQDFSGTNNANMSTPGDGESPRMQMYLWDAVHDVDSSADAEIVYHEYTHGLSGRLVGLGATQSGAMGEGWSDFYALDLLVHEGTKTDPAGPGNLRMGQYVSWRSRNPDAGDRLHRRCDSGSVSGPVWDGRTGGVHLRRLGEDQQQHRARQRRDLGPDDVGPAHSARPQRCPEDHHRWYAAVAEQPQHADDARRDPAVRAGQQREPVHRVGRLQSSRYGLPGHHAGCERHYRNRGLLLAADIAARVDGRRRQRPARRR